MSIGSILIYGESGVGKTVATHRVFKKALVLRSEEDAHDSVLADLGVEPACLPLPVEFQGGELFKKLEQLACVINREIASKKYTTIVIDSGTELADRLLMDHSLNVASDPRHLYPAVEMQFKLFLTSIWKNDRWLVMLCHESAPGSTSDGMFFRGGPKFPGRQLPGILQHRFSVVARACFDPMTQERQLVCEPGDTSWYYKDRFGILKNEQPLDLAPLVQGILKLKTKGARG